jgi:predicted  nucleic acid-binding Zn-ribbon protein
LTIVDQIRVLEDLAKLDAELRTVGDKLSEERGMLGGLKSALAAVKAKIVAEREAVTRTEKARSEAQTELRSTATQSEASRDKLNRVRTERETNAVQRELEELKKLQRDREEEIERFAKSLEVIRATLDAALAEEARIEAELAEKESAIAANVGELETSHGSKAGGRDALVKALPTILYRRYDAVRQKRGSGLAKTTNGTCSACNIALPPQMFHRLRREPMIEQCPSCNRIIYFAPPIAPSVSS